MHKIDGTSASTTQPSIQPDGPNVGGYFRPANPEAGHVATSLDYDWCNAIQNELANVVVAAGFALDKANQSQLLQSIQALINTAVNNVDPYVVKAVEQNGHGFNVGEYVYFNGSNWARASAASLNTAWTLGLVQTVLSTNQFRLLMIGYTDEIFEDLIPGATYYLSTTPGQIQTERPSNIGEVIKPVLIADSTTSGYFYNWEPFLVGNASGDLLAANNLSDLADIPTARENLGLGTAALADAGDFLGVADLDDYATTDYVDTEITDLNLSQYATTAYVDGIADTIGVDMNAVEADIAAINTELGDIQADLTTINTDIDTRQPLDATLTALAALSFGANNYIYSSGADAFALGTITSYARGLLDDADAPAARSTLLLGTAATANVDDFASTADISTINAELSGKQPLDATLTALAGTTIAANKLPYGSGTDTFATTDLTSFSRTLLGASDADSAKSILEVEGGGGGGTVEVIEAVHRLGGGSLIARDELIITDFTADFMRYRINFSDCKSLTIEDARLVGFLEHSSPSGSYNSRLQYSAYGSSNTTHSNSTNSWAYLTNVGSTGGSTGVVMSGYIDIYNPMHASPTIIICRSTGMSYNWSVKLLDIMSIAGSSALTSSIRIRVNDGSSTYDTFNMEYSVFGYKA